MPVPSSVDAQHGLVALGAHRHARRALSAGENLSALDTRLPMICSRRTGSALTHTGSVVDLDPGAAFCAATRSPQRRSRTLSAEIDALAIEDDLSGHDAADVQEIVHEARHVQRLAVDDVAGVRRARLPQAVSAPSTCTAPLDGAQRIAQLVRQHRQELVLRLALALHLGQGADVGDDQRAVARRRRRSTWLTETCASSAGMAAAGSRVRSLPAPARDERAAAPPDRLRR